MSHKKKVQLKLVGLDGNAFSILGAFQRQARREGWTKKEIDAVIEKAQSGDYANLVSVIASHCESPAGGADSDDYDSDSERDEDDEEELSEEDDEGE